ncbi:nuclease-related domain-containing protein [Nocardioides sp. KR10-350]|uniref:nuclease-related domain-containing protein n=1 Tax=Nocardioides cheoyonin TaxID=3156615 RepID=UPI0032B44980
MAGESADEVARRQREKAERLVRSAERYERGAEGERATAAALACLPSGWTAFHDVRWPERRLANVDHVVVGPGGVFVIDSKNWSGTVAVRAGVLRHNGYRRERTVDAAGEAALAVARLVADVPPEAVYAVLCFAGSGPEAGWVGGVAVCTPATLVELLTTRPVALAEEQVAWAATRLDVLLQGATQTSRRPPDVVRGSTTCDGAGPAPGRAAPPPTPAPREAPRGGRRRHRARRKPRLGRLVAVVVVTLVAVGLVRETDVVHRISDEVVRIGNPEPSPTPR